jgi:hypothetical protein
MKQISQSVHPGVWFARLKSHFAEVDLGDKIFDSLKFVIQVTVLGHIIHA